MISLVIFVWFWNTFRVVHLFGRYMQNTHKFLIIYLLQNQRIITQYGSRMAQLCKSNQNLSNHQPGPSSTDKGFPVRKTGSPTETPAV